MRFSYRNLLPRPRDLALGLTLGLASMASADEAPDESCNLELTPELAAAVVALAGPDDPALAAAAPDPDGTREANVRPRDFQPSDGRSCHRYHGRRVCDGPRRIPVPSEGAQRLAAELGIGSKARMVRLLREPVPPELLAHAGSARADLFWPVANGRLWRQFGMVGRGRRRHLHKGLDIGAPEGSPIRVVNDGLVVYSDNGMSGYGNIVIVLHADATFSTYAHARANFVNAGDRVRRGQVISEVGETGLARGAHLHFEFRRNGAVVSPIDLFLDRPHVGDPRLDVPPEELPTEE